MFMQLVLPNSRASLTKEDLKFIARSLTTEVDEDKAIHSLMTDTESMDLILDKDELWTAIMESTAPLKISLEFYFYQSGDDEVKADLLFTDISIVVQERNEPFIFATIPYDSIVSVSYERSAHPRVKTAIFFSPFWLLSKSKKHWLIVNYSKCVFR